MNAPTPFSDADSAPFLVRWRGRQEGPYSASVLNAKLAANEVGLLHEIHCDGRWVTIRDYMARREMVLRAEQQAQEQQERINREQAERRALEREDENRTATIAEERRRNDLLAASVARQYNPNNDPITLRAPLKLHRGSSILCLALVGLFFFGPLCSIAWVMGNSDLQEMDAGIMDPSGRSTTAAGRTVGAVGTVLWVIGIYFFVTNIHNI